MSRDFYDLDVMAAEGPHKIGHLLRYLTWVRVLGLKDLISV